MEAKYPRSRDETGELPDQSENTEHCKRFWVLEVTGVRRANSRCVFFCDSLRNRIKHLQPCFTPVLLVGASLVGTRLRGSW